MKNKKVLGTVKAERNIPHTIEMRKANRIGHVLRTNCLLKHVTERAIEGEISDGTRMKKNKQLQKESKEREGY